MENYLNLLREIKINGRYVSHRRTQTKCLHIVGPQLEFDLQDGFPLVTTRNVPFKNILTELLWFLKGDTNIEYLHKFNNRIWDAWSLSELDLKKSGSRDIHGNLLKLGECGPIYGKQWREWRTSDYTTVDQIQILLNNLIHNPSSRRHIVSAWNPEFLPDERISPQENVIHGKQCLPPCHTMFQFMTQRASLIERFKELSSETQTQFLPFFKTCRFSTGKGLWKWLKTYFSKKSLLTIQDRDLDPEDCEKGHEILDTFKWRGRIGIPRYILHLKLYARSQDVPLGTVFNIASYSLLLSMVAYTVKMIPGKYIHTIGDAHIYENQLPGVDIQLQRKPLSRCKLKINENVGSLFDYEPHDIGIEDYQHYPTIKFPISV